MPSNKPKSTILLSLDRGHPLSTRIAIEGAIGSGKTSTALLVAQRLDCGAVLEQTDTHPFLADFYSDIETFKLETELGFLLLHYHQLHVLRPDQPVVTDFSYGKDLI